MHHLLVIPKHHVENILESDVDTVKQLENAAFDFLESDPDAQRLKIFDKKDGVPDFDMVFHRPPLTSVDHLHLHVVYPVSEMTSPQKKRIRNRSFIRVHKWLGTEFKTNSKHVKFDPPTPTYNLKGSGPWPWGVDYTGQWRPPSDSTTLTRIIDAHFALDCDSFEKTA